MFIVQENLENLYIQLMNECIKNLPEYEDGMLLVHIGSGYEVQINKVKVSNPQISAMLSVANKICNKKINDFLSQLSTRIKH